jgi:ABC-type lipoprotein export system ATPase subunit
MKESQLTDQKWMIAAHNVWRTYGQGEQEVVALRGINLQVPAGHFLAIKGRSGSGKTTLLNILAGLDHPSLGEVVVLGEDLTTLDENHLTEWRRKQVGLVFQSFGLLPTLSAVENVEFLLRLNGGRFVERQERAMACLDLVGLTKWAHHRPYEMSGGQQQRVAIARALANQPALILADEPTGELDSNTGREILHLLRRIVDEQGVTILMVSHDPAVDEFAGEILHLRDGLAFPQA